MADIVSILKDGNNTIIPKYAYCATNDANGKPIHTTYMTRGWTTLYTNASGYSTVNTEVTMSGSIDATNHNEIMVVVSNTGSNGGLTSTIMPLANFNAGSTVVNKTLTNWNVMIVVSDDGNSSFYNVRIQFTANNKFKLISISNTKVHGIYVR